MEGGDVSACEFNELKKQHMATRMTIMFIFGVEFQGFWSWIFLAVWASWFVGSIMEWGKTP